DLDPSFEENDFALEDNMTSATAYAEDVEEEQSDSFSVLFPLETAGSELSEKKEKELDDGKRVIMTFEGEKHFTLIEEKRTAAPALSEPKEVEGDIVNLKAGAAVLFSSMSVKCFSPSNVMMTRLPSSSSFSFFSLNSDPAVSNGNKTEKLSDCSSSTSSA